MQRLRFIDVRLSSIPSAVGLCAADGPKIAAYLNSAQRRLIQCPEAGEEGWWGTWAEAAFAVSQTTPFITLPRGVARMQLSLVCNRPVSIQNQFYEYLEFGNGRLPNLRRTCPGQINFYSENSAVTFSDLPSGSYVSIFATNASDVGKRVLIQGLDANNINVRTLDGTNPVDGVFYTFPASLNATSLDIWNKFTGIQKDITVGPINIYAVNPTTGAQTLIHTMEPTETTAYYRRYYLNPAPLQCCNSQLTPGVVQVNAIVKLDLIPVIVDTDYCLIQNLEALEEECKSVRYSRMDNTQSKAMARVHHKSAVGYLNGELSHFLGKDQPAVNFAPFGDAHLSRKRIGSLI